ncbi:ABC transporter permease [Geobacter pickeringii]|uniref:ABC transporter permease n=1 Tax=Geobacter pickeringii TaxID=345632 RepID=UPI000A079C7F|nr:ABC transporter permease [Geobacter pickeringii]
MKQGIPIIGAIPLVLFLALWELLPHTGIVDPVFLPPLSAVVENIAGLWQGGDLQTHALVSLQRALGGFLAAVVLGLPLGLVVGGWFPRLQAALEPLMELFAQTNPVVLFHIIILFLGIGEGAKTFIIGWLCLWPVAFSAMNGVRNADPLLIKAARSLGIGRLKLFVSVVLPSAAPLIFAGLRLSAGYAFIMLVAAEMMGASSGLGWLVIQAQESYHVARIFAGAAVITGLALSVDGVLKLIGGWLAPVRETKENQPLGIAACNDNRRDR